MKKWKRAVETAVSVCYAAGLFYCLLYGAPQEKTLKIPYIIMAAITCILIPAGILAERHEKMKLYRENRELHKRINSLKKNAAKLDK